MREERWHQARKRGGQMRSGFREQAAVATFGGGGGEQESL